MIWKVFDFLKQWLWKETFPLYKEGELVFDELTKSEAYILKINYDNYGNMRVWLDSNYLDGFRYPWEVTRIRKKS